MTTTPRTELTEIDMKQLIYTLEADVKEIKKVVGELEDSRTVATANVLKRELKEYESAIKVLNNMIGEM